VAKMKVTLKGADLGEWDEEQLTLRDAFAIKAASGLSLKPFFQGLRDMDPLAMQVLVWFMRFKKSDSVPMPEIDFVITDLDMVEVDPPTEPAAAATLSAGDVTTPSAP
jgi:hypothetical protein